MEIIKFIELMKNYSIQNQENINLKILKYNQVWLINYHQNSLVKELYLVNINDSINLFIYI